MRTSIKCQNNIIEVKKWWGRRVESLCRMFSQIYQKRSMEAHLNGTHYTALSRSSHDSTALTLNRCQWRKSLIDCQYCPCDEC